LAKTFKSLPQNRRANQIASLEKLPKRRRGTHRSASLYAFRQKRPMIIEMV
jgi:uncharacterized protein YfdQ (DUF2303 family)